MTGYVFLGNSTKPTSEIANSREDVKLDNVSKPCLKAALEMGYKVILGVNRNKPEELICPELPISLYDSHTYRSITAVKDNYTAYKNLKKVVSREKVEVIHCNTPVGGMIGRLVAKRCKVKKVIYTAHGFHFYKGAPLFNRTVLKWAEMLMARWTDAIITMNKEDYEAAKCFKLKKNGKVYFVHGVGIDLSDYAKTPDCREAKRAELNMEKDDIALISMGDLVARKNYAVAIESIAKANNPKLKYFICGVGPELEKLKTLTKKLNIENQVIFLGYRNDIKELLKSMDIFLFTTLQEGLPRSMMEAMASGLPCIASEIRGNVDLIASGSGGYLCASNSVEEFSEAINKLSNDANLKKKMSDYNLEEIKKYDISVVKKEIEKIYNEVLYE